MTTTEELEEFCTWFDDEGGLPSFLIARSGEGAPEEIAFEVSNFLASWDVLKYSFDALLHSKGVTY